jgi:hypothetical protein
MTAKEINDWLLEHKLLFAPSNKRPTPEEAEMVFKIANILDKTQIHKPTSCGRCYGNALRAIQRNLQIF